MSDYHIANKTQTYNPSTQQAQHKQVSPVAYYKGHAVQQKHDVKVAVTAYNDQGIQKNNKSLKQRNIHLIKNPSHIQHLKPSSHGLYTSEEMILVAGAPKKDKSYDTFLGTITLKKNSTGYKSILKQLDDYHEAAASDCQGTTARDTLEELEKRLVKLHKAVGVYSNIFNYSHSRKVQLAPLKKQIQEQLSVVKTLNSAIGKKTVYQDWSADLTLNAVLQATTKKEMNTLSYQAAGFSKAETALLQQHGLTIQDGLGYRAVGLGITPETMPTTVNNNLSQPLEKLGNGSFNTVYKATTNTSNGPRTVAFKPLTSLAEIHKEKFGWVAKRIGIDEENPKYAQRNLATSAVAKQLGFDVVAKTEIGVVNGQPGIVMELAPGVAGSKLTPEDLNDPEVRRELTKLQLLDAIMGQGDRHRGNYFVSRENGKVKVTGIDNDQCAGHRITNPNRMTPDSGRGYKGVKLPWLIDKETADSIMQLKPDQLGALLVAHQLSPAEIDAAKKRLDVVQSHVQHMRYASGSGQIDVKSLNGSTGCIVDSKNWKNQDFQRLQLKENSYAGRDFQRAQARRRHAGPRPVPPTQQPLLALYQNLQQYGLDGAK